MELAFTDHVRSLEPGNEESYRDNFDAAWKKLRNGLKKEMKVRSLWLSPPSFLGGYGHTGWTPDALDDLLVDVYLYAILRPLTGLKALLEVQDNVEGVVLRNLRNFLSGRQKMHDPLGFRVFELLSRAVRQAIEREELVVIDGNPEVRNPTLLGFPPVSQPARPADDLGDPVRGWCDDLLPELVTATKGAPLEGVARQLAALVVELRARGVEAFRFKDVIDPLKQEARARWNAIWQVQEGETAHEDGAEALRDLILIVQPDTGFEEREVFGKLAACVTEALPRLEVREKTRRYLRALWTFIRVFAVDSPAGKVPSGRKIAEELGIPRYRLPELHATLGREVERCREP